MIPPPADLLDWRGNAEVKSNYPAALRRETPASRKQKNEPAAAFPTHMLLTMHGPRR
jgi:hypothetical protein